MPVLSLPSFAKGLIAPNIYGRVDTNLYKIALRTARNAIIHPYGGVSNRAGLLCILPFKYHTLALFPRIFRFHQGTSDQYVLEFGNLYMRVVRNDLIVTNTAVTITDVTKATSGVVTAAAHGYSDGQDVYIVMAAGMTELDKRRFLVRNVTTNTFTLEDLITGLTLDTTDYTTYTTGGTVADVFELTTPYLQADLSTLKMVQSGNTITITHTSYAPRDLTRTDHNNWPLTTNTFAPSLAAPTNGTISSTFDSNFQVFTEGGLTVNYRVTAISDTDGNFEESLPLTITGTDGSDPPLNTLTWTAVADASRYAVYRQDNGLYGLLGETELTTFEDKNLGTDLTISPPSARNPFSTLYPMASGYYQQRQVYGGTTVEPDKSWYSQTGLRLNMSVSSPLQPSDAITASLSSQDVQEIRHYVPIGKDLMIMTNSGEWRINSGPDSDFSADTIRQNPETNWGSSHDVPIVVGKTILFVEDGRARVRSLGFEFTIDGFDTNDLTILANHLLADKSSDEYVITDWSFGQFPEPRVYMVRSDGRALTLTFDKEQQVVAWTIWDTRGDFKATTSLRRSVSGVEDGIYFGIRRRSSTGDYGNYLERLHSRKFNDVRNAYFVDHGTEINVPITITDVSNADPAIFTTEEDHDLVKGDEIELSNLEWLKDIADECSDEEPSQFNDLRFTVANPTARTFELLDRTLEGGGDWDLSTASADTELIIGPDISAGHTTGMRFNSDGTKVFLLDGVNATLHWWDLSIAWDVGSGSEVYGGSQDLTASDGTTLRDITGFRAVKGFDFNAAGTELFVTVSEVSVWLYQYTLSGAFDATTLSHTRQVDLRLNNLIPNIDRWSLLDVTVSDNGLLFYFLIHDTFGATTAKVLSQCSVSVQDNISDLGSPTYNLDVGAVMGDFNSHYIRRDGTQLFIVEEKTSTIIIHEWTLATANELVSNTYEGTLELPGTSEVNRGLSVNFKETDGGKMFVISDFGRRVLQYDLTPVTQTVDVGKLSTEIYQRGGEARKLFTVIRDLWCLEGQAPSLFIDGNLEDSQTVVDGKITVADSRSAARAQVGLPYTCDIELLDIEIGTPPDTIQGKLKRVQDVTIRFYKSRMPLVGPNSSQLQQIRTRSLEKMGEASRLLSGDININLPPDWNSNGRIFFRQCDPVPMTIIAVFPNLIGEDKDDYE